MYCKKGDSVYIQSFKHDGSLHRTWCKGFVLESDDDRFVAVTNKAWVIEGDGRKWFTREPAVCFFWTHRWYNVIAMLRKNGIYYYCNLASPSLYDGEAIKNIDYDLDIKLYPDLSYQILDENEYNLPSLISRFPRLLSIFDFSFRHSLQMFTIRTLAVGFCAFHQLFFPNESVDVCDFFRCTDHNPLPRLDRFYKVCRLK